MDNNAVNHIDNNHRSAPLFYISSPETDFSVLLDKREKFGTNTGKISFILVLSGSALIEIDDKAWKLHRGVFLFITPRHTLRLLVSSDDFTYRFILSDFDFMADFPLLLKPEVAKVAGNIPCIPIDNASHRIFQQYYDLIYSRYNDSKSKMRQIITQGLLFSFITEINQIYSGTDKSIKSVRQEKIADKFFSLLHKFFKHERRASFYADHLCVSDKHLMRTVKEQTGFSVHYWIADFVIQEAKLMLKSSDKSVIEISDELSFPNSSSFARFFRKHVNSSPLEFRNRISKTD